MLATAIGVSLWIIVGGIVVEPPAALMEAIDNPTRVCYGFWRARHSMSMMTNTLGRYFAGRFVSRRSACSPVFSSAGAVDYIEMVRKTSGLASVSAITVAETSLFRVPQLLEKNDAVLHPDRSDDLLSGAFRGDWTGGARAPAFRRGSHRAGAGKFRSYSESWRKPLTIRFPQSAELSKRMEAELFGSAPGAAYRTASGFWINQVNSEGQGHSSTAARSEQQGVAVDRLTVCPGSIPLPVKKRIEAREPM